MEDHREADQRRRLAAAEADAAPKLSLLADQAGTPRGGPRPTGLQLVVANDGPADVRLVSGRVVPAAWGAVVTNGALESGSSVRVELAPPAGCAVERPRRLLLRTRLASGRVVTSELDLAHAPLLYGGHLDGALAALALTCDSGLPPALSQGRAQRSGERASR